MIYVAQETIMAIFINSTKLSIVVKKISMKLFRIFIERYESDYLLIMIFKLY